MFHFLEREGAQVLVEPIGTWIMYMIHQVIQKYNDIKGLEEGAVLPPIWQLGTRAKIEFGFRQKVAKLKLAEAIFKREYHRIVNSLGGIAHHLADQYELQRLGHPFYNSRAGGGEGHLEVAKNIYYSQQRPGAHGAVAEAVRLHAEHAVRRRAGRRRVPLTRT